MSPTRDGHLERICEHAGVLRLGGAYGEPYRFVVAVKIRQTSAEVLGLTQRPTRDDWRGVARVLGAEGIARFRYQRRRKRTNGMRWTRWFTTSEE